MTFDRINTANVSDDATLELRETNTVATAAVGGSTCLFAAGRDDDGVSVFRLDDGSLGNIAEREAMRKAGNDKR